MFSQLIPVSVSAVFFLFDTRPLYQSASVVTVCVCVGQEGRKSREDLPDDATCGSTSPVPQFWLQQRVGAFTCLIFSGGL